MLLKSRIALSFLLLSLGFATPLQAQPPVSSDAVFSIKPLAMLYVALLGADEERADDAESRAVNILYPSDVNLHDYALALSDIEKLLNAKTLYWLGASNEDQLDKLLPRFKQLRSQALAADAGNHAWLNPEQLWGIINTLAETMRASMPQQQARIRQNQQRLIFILEALLQQYQQRLSDYEHTPVLIGHSAFGELLHYMNLKETVSYSQGHSHGGHDIGTKAKLGVQQMISQGHIYCAIEEPDVSFVNLQKRFPQLRTIKLEPMADSQAMNSKAFATFIEQSLAAIESCLLHKKPSAYSHHH